MKDTPQHHASENAQRKRTVIRRNLLFGTLLSGMSRGGMSNMPVVILPAAVLCSTSIPRAAASADDMSDVIPIRARTPASLERYARAVSTSACTPAGRRAYSWSAVVASSKTAAIRACGRGWGGGGGRQVGRYTLSVKIMQARKTNPSPDDNRVAINGRGAAARDGKNATYRSTHARAHTHSG